MMIINTGDFRELCICKILSSLGYQQNDLEISVVRVNLLKEKSIHRKKLGKNIMVKQPFLGSM